MDIALFLDIENVSSHLADQIMLLTAQQGHILYCCAYGHAAALQNWKRAIDYYHILGKEVKSMAKNASDHCIQANMYHAFFNEGINSLYLATHDGGYCPCVQTLSTTGCSVIIIGQAFCMSYDLKQNCTIIYC